MTGTGTGSDAAGDGDGADGRRSDALPSIERLAADAREAREAADAPTDPPDSEAALVAARDGLGPVVARYIAARTGETERLSARQLDGLDRATNDWLAAYARHHGVETDPDVTVRTAAELVIETHDVVATARLLTDVPDR
ncbi:hypothetical protein [Halorarum halobium]|uniref:hypothetical protein n=1 Tax=Halorarum halobium TaxID=3075121 RepID=UPI0028ACA7C2|nr:hypothetical protein [Halobaculum sp. XH14]